MSSFSRKNIEMLKNQKEHMELRWGLKDYMSEPQKSDTKKMIVIPPDDGGPGEGGECRTVTSWSSRGLGCMGGPGEGGGGTSYPATSGGGSGGTATVVENRILSDSSLRSIREHALLGYSTPAGVLVLLKMIEALQAQLKEKK